MDWEKGYCIQAKSNGKDHMNYTNHLIPGTTRSLIKKTALYTGHLFLINRGREKVVDDGFEPFEELEQVLQLTHVLVLVERESCSVWV